MGENRYASLKLSAIVLAVDGAPDDPSKPSLSGSLKDLRTAVTDLRSGYDVYEHLLKN